MKVPHLNISRALRFALLPLLAASSSAALVASLLAAPPPATSGQLGQMLALRAALRPLVPSSAHAKTFQDLGVPTDLRRASDGRYVYRKPDVGGRMHAGAILRSHAAGAAAAQVDEAVQTFDVFNPPPAFALAQGASLTPTNLTPVWSSDETMLIFSSNRTAAGAAGTRYHIWAVPINGGAAIQLTASAGPAGGGEFFPALSADNNRQLAFTSDANTPGIQNLYSIATSTTTTTVTGLPSPTSRGADAAGNPVSGIAGVGRPAFSPADSGLLAFSALSATGTNAGHQHLYFLYTATGGFNPTSVSLPAKITDGPSDDTDPAFSQDGQYIAFASTASSTTATGAPPSADPNTAPIATSIASGTTAASNRALFLISSAYGLANGGAPVTAAGSGDNFGPAWSSAQSDPYLNTSPGKEYLAFARGASQAAPHDIYYLNVLQNTQAGGETGRSNEASSTPLNPAASPNPNVLGYPVYQVNAGDTNASDSFGGFVADTFIVSGGQTPFQVIGGTADAPAATPIVYNTTADPGTDPRIYQTDRSGPSSYVFPNLTPGATYLVRLHLADNKDTAAGKRIFNVAINGQASPDNIDIISLAQASPGRLDGSITDAATGAAVAATVTLTPAPAATDAAIASTTTATADPNGGAPVNYNAPVTQGTYTATVTAAGYGTVSRQVTISSGAYSRADFLLSMNTATGSFSGQVTDTNSVSISGIVISVTDADGATVPVSGSAVSDAGGNYGPLSLAPGTYFVTATPPAGQGSITQTQTLTVTAGTASSVNFSLSNITSASVGSLGGLVTSSVTGAALSGATVTVRDANNSTVAIVMTGAQSSPAAPNGDGNPVNYFANLPTGNYSLQFTEPGFGVMTKAVTVVNMRATANAFARADQALAAPSGAVGPNTAVVVTYSVTVPFFGSTNADGLITSTANAITLAFNPVSGDPPIVQGIEILSDPAPAFSSGFGSSDLFTTFTSSGSVPEVQALGGSNSGVPQITLDLTPSAGAAPSYYNVYRSSGHRGATNAPPPSGVGSEQSAVYATNVPGPFFTDTGVVFGSEYYYQVTAVYQRVLAPESTANSVVQLNTSDPGNAYDDIYPTWSPFRTVFSIAYSSNRTVTYTDPATGTASETAISIGANSSLGNGGTVGAAYAGLLESQVVNLDPPTLVPYSGNEVLHINTGAGFSAASFTRTGVTPGQPATITVRLSSREAGINNSRVYLQIKDPDSKYQDQNGLEHKVFASDYRFRTQQNNPNRMHPDSGSSAYLMNGGSALPLAYHGNYSGFNQFPNLDQQTKAISQRGSVGGTEDAGAQTGAGSSVGGNTADTISVGRSGGGRNTQPVLDATGKIVLDSKKNTARLPGTDPSVFIPTGPEFECQVVNPIFTGLDTVPTDYVNPYWLAGVDDQQPFSGVATDVRPTTEWLPMKRLPAAQQDGQGGVLYSVTWKTPTSPSDYYLDVIAFDNAVAPSSYAATGGLTGNGPTGIGSNWRIYDNVWGFSTQASIGSKDILLVSDYALGQKFAASTFGGQRGLLNLVPKLYGAESYVSDVDAGLLPNAIYRYAVYPGANPKVPQNEVLSLAVSYNPADTPEGDFTYPRQFLPLNGLGVNSYLDSFVDDGTRTPDQLPNVRSQAYSIWRTLARGPIPTSVYAAYEPSLQAQPAVSDAGGAAAVSIPAGTVPVATRCIVWISPFTGDVLAGPGTLVDPNTQNNLRSFVAAGGRLCVSGQDVGSALTQNGTANNGPGGFLSDVLNATLASSNQGTHLPMGGTDTVNNRISNIPSYDGILQGSYQEIIPGDLDIVSVSTATRPIRISNNYGRNIFAANLVFTPAYSGNWRTDGSLDQLGPYIQAFPEQSSTLTAASAVSQGNNTNSVVAQIDTIKPNSGANVHTDLNLGAFENPIPTPPVDNLGNVNASSAAGGVGLIYSENPITASGGTGSKVVYATFGLEGLSTEYYKVTDTNAPNSVIYAARNQRQNILHNIVSYLRTGSIAGTIRSTSGNNTVGAGIPNATVYVQSAYGPAIPGRGTFSATTDSAGNYIINGLEPGNYTLVAYKTGYSRAASNPGTVLTVEGDVAVQGANLSLVQGGFGIITGVVKDAAGKTVAGATVTFTPGDSGSVQSIKTDANGSYTLSNVPTGTYTGTAAAAGAAATAPATTVAANASVTVNFTLAPGAGSATGRVVDTSGAPIPGAKVFFNGGAGAVLSATTDSTGTYAFPTGTLPSGSYTVTATATGYGASPPIQVVITSAAVTQVPDITLGVAVNGTLGGLVTSSSSTTPAGGVTITIINTATGQAAVTTAPVSSATATAAPDGSGSINYGPISLPQGTYTVTATQGGISTATQTITVPPNGFARADFTGAAGLQPLYTFPAGIQFVSTPYNYTSLGFDGLFGVKNTAPSGATPNGNRSSVAVWNPLVGAYALDPTPPADALRPGVGYWVYLKNAMPVTSAGTALTGSVSVQLNPAWNQIGVPNPAGVPVSSLTFTGSNGTAYSFADAASSTYHLISGTLYSYNGTAYQPVSSGATLQPWQAYWIRVYTPVTVNIPTGK